MTTRQLCTFEVDGLLLGVDVARVQEVIRHQPLTPVPLARPEIRGLMNLRGQIVTAMDLRHRLGFAARADAVDPPNVVLRAAGGAVSLLVDEIGDVLDVDDSRLDRAPDTVDSAFRALVTDTYKLDERLLLVLDSERLVAPAG